MNKRAFQLAQMNRVKTLLKKGMNHQQKVEKRVHQIYYTVPQLNKAKVFQMLQVLAQKGNSKAITLEDVASFLHDSQA